MKVSHEVPFVMMGDSRNFNDFDYALVHLFPDNTKYFDFFKESLSLGREVILDNSVFELGRPVDDAFYLDWILKLKPSYFIAPDCFEDADYTIKSVKKWALFSKENNLKMIGVVQGGTLEEMTVCYKEIEPLCDKVAFSFAQPFFSRLINTEVDAARTFGRVFLINSLLQQDVINVDKKHHLLGCSLPQELLSYKHPAYSFIDSVDSSSPIVHGYEGVKYNKWGLTSKIKRKLVDIIDLPLKNQDLIMENVQIFKTLI